MKALAEKKLFLLDMDGTIYLDGDVFPDTIPFLNTVKEKGGRYLFLTNNSSKSATAYIQKLDGMGIRATEEDFLTSVDATIVDLRSRYTDEKMYVFGTRSFFTQLKEAGLNVTQNREEDVKVLVMGFDTELTFSKLEDACILLGKGVDYIATNPDYVCPTRYGSVPDCGSIAGILKTATGRYPRFIGKPNPEMIYLALEKTGYTKEDAVLIGDRVYTDIASGVHAGIDTVLVLSGEGTVADAEASEEKPTHILKDIGEVRRAMLA